MNGRAGAYHEVGPQSVLGEELALDQKSRGGERNRTAVQGFAGPCLNHSATPPYRYIEFSGRATSIKSLLGKITHLSHPCSIRWALTIH